MPEPKLPMTVKEYDPADTNPCSGCSNCCEYVIIHVDTPKTVKDFSDLYWYVIHKDVWLYIDHEGDWNVQFNTPCEKLKDKRCGIYLHRPTVCRTYSPSNCPRYNVDPAEKHLFKNEIDLFQYLASKRPKLFKKFVEKNNLRTEDVIEMQTSGNGRGS